MENRIYLTNFGHVLFIFSIMMGNQVPFARCKKFFTSELMAWNSAQAPIWVFLNSGLKIRSWNLVFCPGIQQRIILTMYEDINIFIRSNPFYCPSKKITPQNVKSNLPDKFLSIFLLVFSIMMGNYAPFASCKKFFTSELKGVK